MHLIGIRGQGPERGPQLPPAANPVPTSATPTIALLATDTTARLLIAVEPGLSTSNALASISDEIARLQQEQVRLKKNHEEWQRRHTDL